MVSNVGGINDVERAHNCRFEVQVKVGLPRRFGGLEGIRRGLNLSQRNLERIAKGCGISAKLMNLKETWLT